MDTRASLVQRLIACRAARASDLQGCSDAEIDALQAQLGLPLPKAYREFLRLIGRSSGRFMRDIDFTVDKVPSFRATAEDILGDWEDGRLKLLPCAVVFSMRYGEQFMFFLADGSDEDPPVFHYLEGQGHFRSVANSIWRVIEEELEIAEDLFRTNPHSPSFEPPKQW